MNAIASFNARSFDQELHANEFIVILLTFALVFCGREVHIIHQISSSSLSSDCGFEQTVLYHLKILCSIPWSTFFQFFRHGGLEAIKNIDVELVCHDFLEVLSKVLSKIKAVIIYVAVIFGMKTGADVKLDGCAQPLKNLGEESIIMCLM